MVSLSLKWFKTYMVSLGHRLYVWHYMASFGLKWYVRPYMLSLEFRLYLRHYTASLGLKWYVRPCMVSVGLK